MIFGHFNLCPNRLRTVIEDDYPDFDKKLQDLEEFDGSRNKLKTLPSTITKGMLFDSLTVYKLDIDYNGKWKSSIMEHLHIGPK